MPGSMAGLPGAEQTHRVLAMQAAHRHEFIQDAAPLLAVARHVSPRQCTHQLIPCRHADLPHCRPLPMHTGREYVE